MDLKFSSEIVSDVVLAHRHTCNASSVRWFSWPMHVFSSCRNIPLFSPAPLTMSYAALPERTTDG